MSRHFRCRELQASVSGLERLNVAVVDSVASACSEQINVLIVGGGGGREIELLAQHNTTASLTVVDPSSSNLREAELRSKEMGYRGSIRFVEDLPQGRISMLSRSSSFFTQSMKRRKRGAYPAAVTSTSTRYSGCASAGTTTSVQGGFWSPTMSRCTAT